MIRKSMSNSANNSVWAMVGDMSCLAPSGKLARCGPGTRTETGFVRFVKRAEGSHRPLAWCSKDFCVGSAGLVMLAPRHPAHPSLWDQTSKDMNLTAGALGLVLERCREGRGGGERVQLATAMESHGEDITVPM